MEKFIDEDGDAQEIVSPSVPGGVPREEASHPDSADMSLDDDHDTDSDGAEDGVKVSRGACSVKGPVWGHMFGQVGFCVFVLFSVRQFIRLRLLRQKWSTIRLPSSVLCVFIIVVPFAYCSCFPLFPPFLLVIFFPLSVVPFFVLLFFFRRILFRGKARAWRLSGKSW